MIDLISRGRLVSGWVRGTGRESVAHNIPPHYNWERFQEAHEFIVKAWTTPGPFRWEGKHFHFRHVNPWVRPVSKDHIRPSGCQASSAVTPYAGRRKNASPTSCWPPKWNQPGRHFSSIMTHASRTGL